MEIYIILSYSQEPFYLYKRAYQASWQHTDQSAFIIQFLGFERSLLEPDNCSRHVPVTNYDM